MSDSTKQTEGNPALKQVVDKNTELKEWLVNYVGGKISPDNDEVTVEMVLEVVASEFPEFVLPIAEENFIRGYNQAFIDIQAAEQLELQRQETVNE